MQTNNAPAYNVTIGGATFTQTDPKGLEMIVIEDNLEMIGRAEFTFRSGESNTSFASFQVGGAVEVKVGGGSRKMFVGKITKVNHGKSKGANTCTVVAMDPLHETTKSKNTKTWDDMKDSDVVSEVLGSYPLGTVDATDVTRKYIYQKNESDFNFVRRLAARSGYNFYADEGKIQFVKPQPGSGGVTIEQDNVVDFDYDADPERSPGSVTVTGWDHIGKATVEGSASEGDLIKIGSGEPAIGSREHKIDGVQVADQAEAKAMAVAELNRMSREAVRGSATVQGTPELYVGAMMKVTQQQTGHNPEVMVTSARHQVSNKTGLVSEVEFCSNTKPQ